MKAPHFFIHAKNKENGQVQQINGSVVNQLETIVPNKRMSFSAKNIGLFRYTYLLSDPGKKITVRQEIIDLYDEVEKQYRYSINFYDDTSNFAYIRDEIMKKFNALGYDSSEVCDDLVKYLFHTKQSKRKNIFWMCFGDMVYENLLRNIPEGSIQCKKCGNRFVPVTPQQRICGNCSSYRPLIKKVITCIDCGTKFEVDGIVKNKKRCDCCQADKIRAYNREKKRKQRSAA